MYDVDQPDLNTTHVLRHVDDADLHSRYIFGAICEAGLHPVDIAGHVDNARLHSGAYSRCVIGVAGYLKPVDVRPAT